MGLLDLFKPIQRKNWFLCYACLMQTNHRAEKSIFYYNGPPVPLMGRPLYPCPRCASTNTVSFLQLKEEGAKAQLWGLERIVRANPRSTFDIKPAEAKSAQQNPPEKPPVSS